MQAVIEVEELKQDWKPPFAKKREVRSHSVNEGEKFELLKDGSYLFTIDSIQGDRVKLAYNRVYTLKGYVQPAERMVWLTMHDPQRFASLWEDNGVTKTVTLRSVRAGGVPVETPAEEKAEAHSESAAQMESSDSSTQRTETADTVIESPASSNTETEARPSFEVLRQQAQKEINKSKYSATVTRDSEIYRPN